MSCFSLANEQDINTNIKATALSTMLATADKVRSRDPAKFNQLLSQLQTYQHQFNANQNNSFQYLKAYQAVFSGKFSQGIALASQLINDSNDHALKVRSNMLIVNAHAVSLNWSQGLRQLALLLRELPKVKDNELKSDALIVAALFYNQVGQHNLALNYAQKVELEEKQVRSACIQQQLILESKFKLNLLNENSNEFKQTIAACIKANEPLTVSLSRAYLARYYIDTEQFDKAYQHLQQHIGEAEQTKYFRVIAEFYALLAQVYWHKQNDQQSLHFALKTIALAEELNTTQADIESYYLLHQLYFKQGNLAKALEYHILYTQANETYIDDTKAKHWAFQLAAHKEFENKAQIRFLDEQNKRLVLAKELTEKNQENFILLISLLLTLLTLVIIWAYRAWRNQERLKQLAEYDSLTKTFNRRHFVEVAKTTMKHCQEHQQAVSCIMFDVDNFKKVNDSYGHAAGDEVLKQIAQTCLKICRHNDIFGRIGGEEFGLVLPGCSLVIAQDIANKLRSAIQSIDYQTLGIAQPITASFGVTDATRSGFELEQILADADSAMYSSKHHGRNSVNIFKSNPANV
ncbi:diguanylate cyclase [Thalassotalea sp. PLHSN55]|uniref:diguanylate cyclase n=1 Tax=Thalassotalea sp. PLHSN55 TaxID=3435888 RepID=UPI003F8661C1